MTSTSKVFSGSQSDRERWFIAFNRFGLGAKLGQIDTVQGKPEDWLLHQIDKPSFGFLPNFSSSNNIIERNSKPQKGSKPKALDKLRQSNFQEYNQYVLNQLRHEVSTSAGFDLRVLNFFSNHFSVSKGTPLDTALAPTLEKEAIAPNIFGKFEKLLLAVVKHPAMIRYLDNQTSFGNRSAGPY